MNDLKYQLVLRLPSDTPDDLERLQILEQAVAEALEGSPHQLDGHDIGSGTMNLFIETDDPRSAFRHIQEHAGFDEYSSLRAAYRAFDDDEYKLIWPENIDEAFRLM